MSKLLSAREGLFCRPRAILLALLLVAILTLGPTGRAAAPPPQGEAESAEDEDIIVVTATRLPQPASEVPAAVEVLEEGIIEAAGARNLGEAMRLAPNVMVVSSGGPGALTSPRLQGASSTQVQVLVDGRSINSGLASVDVSRIPLVDVERVEIVEGPVSSLYGANALGGVINIITRRPTRQQDEATVTLGGFGERRLTFFSSDESTNAGYSVGGDLLATDGWRPNSDFSSHALSGKVCWQVQEGQVDLRTNYVKSGGGSPGGNGEYDTWITPTSRYSDETVDLDLSYRSASPDGLTARVYHSAETYDYKDPSTPGHHEAVWQGVEVRTAIRFGAHEAVAGGEYRRDTAVSSHLSEARSSSNLALYAEDLYQAGLWSVTWGGRLDSHSEYGHVFSPRIGVVRPLRADTRLWLSVAKAFRAPSFEDLYWKDGGGNPNLRPETAIVYQAGLRSGGLDLSVFHKDVQDNIAWSMNSGTWRVENVAATTFDGYEIIYRKGLKPWADVTIAYSRLFASDVEQGKPLSYRPAYQGSVSLSTKMPRDWEGVWTVRSVGPQWAEVWDAGATKQVEAPGYTVVDLSFSRTVTPQLKYQILVRNALNARYQEVPGYPMPGASLSTSVTYRF
ncbi:MAG: TonB-dependent receptor plug domain-containing protein [Betaproteobacteria bacterium]